MLKRRRLTLEALEERNLLSVFGTAWPDPGHLTLSFAPDGTAVDGQPSALFQQLSSQQPTQAWQTDVLRAFQTWAANANINIGVVADQGQPIGAAGPFQGDPRFGDFRIAARTLAPDALAIATPFNYFSDTRAGDVVLNSQYPLGDGPGAYDLYQTLLHEAGHALGLDGNDDPTSVMNENYWTDRSDLSASDVAALQALYGARRADKFEGDNGNDSFDRAAPLGPAKLSGVINADVTTAGDLDFYKFRVPGNAASLTVHVQTSGVSLLTAKATLYDAAHNVVATAAAADPLHGDLVLQAGSVQPGTVYYVEVQGATGDVFGIGAYQVKVDFGTGGDDGATASAAVADAQGNDTFRTATALGTRQYQGDARFDYAIKAQLTDLSGLDVYTLRAPTDGRNTLIAMAWGTDDTPVAPRIVVYNAQGQYLPAFVLTNRDGSYIVQLSDVTPGARYYLRVDANPAADTVAGTYQLAVDFRAQAVSVDALAAAAFDASDPQAFRTLQVNEPQVIHFILSTATADGKGGAAVRMRIYDATGQAVFTKVVRADSAGSADVFLTPGTYTVRFEGGAAVSSRLGALGFTLYGVRITDPIDPIAVDPDPMPIDPSSPPPTDPSTDPYASTDPPASPPSDPPVGPPYNPYTNPTASAPPATSPYAIYTSATAVYASVVLADPYSSLWAISDY